MVWKIHIQMIQKQEQDKLANFARNICDLRPRPKDSGLAHEENGNGWTGACLTENMIWKNVKYINYEDSSQLKSSLGNHRKSRSFHEFSMLILSDLSRFGFQKPQCQSFDLPKSKTITADFLIALSNIILEIVWYLFFLFFNAFLALIFAILEL